MITYVIITVVLGTVVQAKTGDDTNPVTNRNKSNSFFLKKLEIRLIYDTYHNSIEFLQD